MASRLSRPNGRLLAWLTALALLAALVPAPALPARATTLATWTGDGDGTSWYDPANWDIGEVPAGYVDSSTTPATYIMFSAVLPAGAIVTLTETTSTILETLVVEPGASLQVRAGALDVRSFDGFNESLGGWGTITNRGLITIGGGGGTTFLRSHEITVDGGMTLTARGHYQIYQRGTEGSPDRTIAGSGRVIFDHADNLNVPSFSYVGIGGTMTFPSTLGIEGTSGTFLASGDAEMRFQGPITATGTGGEILIGHGSGHQTVVMDNVTTIDGGDVHFFAEETVTSGSITAVNGGRVEADFPNPRFAASTFTNEGRIVIEQSELILDTAWTNPGEIIATDSSVELQGTFSTSGFGSIQRTNSPVEINGVMDNTGDTYFVDHSDGVVELRTGTIVGGTIDATGESLRAWSANSSVLKDVTYQGALDLIGGVTTALGVAVDGSITFDPATDNTVTLSGAGITFRGPGDVALGGTADIVMDPALKTTSNQSWIQLNSASATLTIGPDISISGEDGSVGFAQADNSELRLQGSVTGTGQRSLNIGSGGGTNTTLNQGEIRVATTGRAGLFGEFFHNEGVIEVVDGGLLEYRDNNNSRLISEYLLENRVGGTIRVGSGAIFNIVDTIGNPVNAHNAGLIDVVDGGSIVSQGDPTPIVNTGGITGAGTIATDIENHGILLPGGGVGVLTIDGNLTLAGDGILEMDVNGLIPQHDQLSVSGDVTVGGELALNVDPDFAPADGETLTVVAAGGVNGVDGVFDTQTGGFTANDRYLAPDYLADHITLVAGDPPNRPPVIEAIADQSIEEGTTLTIPIVASDPDGDPVDLSLSGEPAGAQIVDGEIVWTPSEEQGPGSFSFAVVADDGRGSTATEPVNVEVAEVNLAPVVDPIEDIVAGPDQFVTFTATATDPDIPTNEISWSLDRGAPAGASIDPATGEFTWLTPELTDRYTIGVIATDDGDPAMQGTTFVDIIVEADPVIIEISEGIGVADIPVVRPPVQIFLSEGIGLADVPVVRHPVEIFLSEGIGVSDTPPITTISTGTVIGLANDLSGDPVAEVGDTLIFEGDAFASDTEIVVELLSDPILLTTTRSDSDGKMSTEIVVPLVEPGEHMLRAVGIGPAGNRHEVHAFLLVLLPADVELVDFDPSVQVSELGGTSVPFTLEATITTPYQDDFDLADGDPGIRLVPVGPGSTVASACDFDGSLLSCVFDQVPVNTYLVQAHIGYPYNGLDEAALVVFDPSLGSASGAGWFYWPGTDEKTNFAFMTKYNKKATNAQGSILVIRHQGDDSTFKMKSNALDGLSLGSSDVYEWASFSGKASYQEPGWDEPIGAHEFVVYVEDVLISEDRFWLRLTDKDGHVVGLSMDLPAQEEAVPLGGGHIRVPRGLAAGAE